MLSLIPESIQLNYISQGNIKESLSNRKGTFELAVIPLVIYVSSVFLYWLSRSKPKVSTIEKIRKSITESSANGLTNFSLIMAGICVFMILFISKLTGNFANDKTGKLAKDKCVDGLTIIYFGEIEGITLLNWGWLLWNQEARLFIFRKFRSGCVSLLTIRSRRSVRVHPIFPAQNSAQTFILNTLVEKAPGLPYQCHSAGLPSVE